MTAITQQEDLFRCVTAILHTRSEEKAISGLIAMHDLTKSGEIRDYNWYQDEEINVYHMLLHGLLLASHQHGGSGNEVSRENLSLLIYSRIRFLDEWNHHKAFNNSNISYLHLVDRIFERIASLSVLSPSSSNQEADVLSPLRTIRLYQHLALDIYHFCHTMDAFRAEFRQHLIKYLLTVQPHRSLSGISGLDSGNSRDHVEHLLPILLVILKGLKKITLTQHQYDLFLQYEAMRPPQSSTNTGNTPTPLHDATIYEDEEYEEEVEDSRQHIAEEGKHDNLQHSSSTTSIHFEVEVLKVRKMLFSDVLVFLHSPHEMIAWRDQIPVIQPYHENLVQCMLALIESVTVMENDQERKVLLVDGIRALLKVWPDGHNTNTPKQVLLLHELDIFLCQCSPFEFHSVQNEVLNKLVVCIGDNADNIRPAQRALEFFKKEKLVEVFFPESSTATTKRSLQVFIPALYRGGVLSWNPTVNKMTALALKIMKERCDDLFTTCCNDLIGVTTSNSGSSKNIYADPNKKMPLSNLPGANKKRRDNDAKAILEDTPSSSVGISMPPPSGLPRSKLLPNPNSKFSTTLPESKLMMGENRLIRNYTSADSKIGGMGSGHNPPVTVTGVAPWAMKPVAPGAGASSSSTPQSKLLPPPSLPKPMIPPSNSSKSVPTSTYDFHSAPSILELPPEKEAENENSDDDNGNEDKGIDRILSYMTQCYAQIFTEDSNSSPKVEDYVYSSVADKAMQIVDMKFHDLAFGKDLGEGAFSTVRYARHITKGKAQAQWPEYAVKIINPYPTTSSDSSSSTKTTNYIPSIIREISLLYLLQHRNITRMISSFHYHEYAYIVLEYAHHGDLHTYLCKHGKLPPRHDLLRYILCEVGSALASIHGLGFVYNDLKPENILITQIGHIKLTDFGACRPIGNEGKRLLEQQSDKVIEMRNGHWKANLLLEEKEDKKVIEDGKDAWKDAIITFYQQSSSDEGEEGDNCEGTPGYMPPEAFRKSADGNQVDIVSRGDQVQNDTWALGCIAYFCFHGKPRFYGEPRQVLDQLDTWFLQTASASAASPHYHQHVSFSRESAKFEDIEDQACEDFIMQLLVKDPSIRMTVANALDHPYLSIGYLPHQSSQLKSHNSVNPPIYNPHAIHNTTPPTWPDVSHISGGGSDDKWARRLFSKLWAPMPKEYDIGGNESGHNHNTAATLLLKTHNFDDGLYKMLRNPLPKVSEDCEEDCLYSFIKK